MAPPSRGLPTPAGRASAGDCSVTLTHFDPRVGGYIAGTFLAAAEVRGHGELSSDSTLTMSGSFRVNVKP